MFLSAKELMAWRGKKKNHTYPYAQRTSFCVCMHIYRVHSSYYGHSMKRGWVGPPPPPPTLKFESLPLEPPEIIKFPFNGACYDGPLETFPQGSGRNTVPQRVELPCNTNCNDWKLKNTHPVNSCRLKSSGGGGGGGCICYIHSNHFRS